MAQLQVNPKSMGSYYVFYNRLKKDGHVELYNAARMGVTQVAAQKRSSSIVNNLKSMSRQEAKKETKLLSKIFGVNIKINQNDPTFYKQLIEALNKSLNLKSIYERNINRIKAEEAQISIAQLFPSYFSKVWNDNSQSIIDKIKLKRGETIIQVADKVLTKELPKLVFLTIERMFQSSDFLGGDEKGYQELVRAIEQQGVGGEYVQQLYKLYHLDELKQSILKTMETTSSKYKRQKIKKANISGTIAKNFFSDGGISLEYLENFIVNSLGNMKVNNKDFKVNVNATHTGATGMKADNIIGFNIDPSILEKIANVDGQTSRKRNIELLKGLNEKLKNLDDSFIIYSNAKNYSLSKNFHGFSSGAALTLANFHDVIANVQKNASTLITAIMNTIPDAVGEDQKANLRDILAADIAYLLFDDVDTIGKDTAGATALHLFNLDGIYIPLSYLLGELANAIDTGLKNPHLFVRVDIKTPNGIKYEKGPYTQEMWHDQSVTALQEITITATFLQNFQELISNLL